jgi:hypothetical protein
LVAAVKENEDILEIDSAEKPPFTFAEGRTKITLIEMSYPEDVTPECFNRGSSSGLVWISR